MLVLPDRTISLIPASWTDLRVAQFRRDLARARYAEQRAERRYRTADPENRLVARGLETVWEKSLRELKSAETELARREQARPRTLTPPERTAVMSLGSDLNRVWSAPTTSDRDRKELLRTLASGTWKA